MEKAEKTFSSKISDKLFVRHENGKKVLDTQNSNYSFGGLQDVLNFGLDSLPVDLFNSVLVLGMGAGCVVDSLRNRYNYHGPVTGVELDPVVIEIARTEFNILKDPKVELIEADAEKFIAETRQKFDLIVIDLFVDIQVPEQFYKPGFWKNVADRVNPNGFILFNAGIFLPEEKQEEFLSKIPDSFIYQLNLNVMISNTVIIFQKVF